MDTTVLKLVKDRIGIRSSVTRDELVETIIKGVIDELKEEKKIPIDLKKSRHLLFVVDYATWIYDHRGKEKGMPRHLQFRLHNLMISR